MAKLSNAKIVPSNEYQAYVSNQGGEDSPHPGYETWDDDTESLLSEHFCGAEELYSGVDQNKLAPERANTWPNASAEASKFPFARVFSKVKATGISNEKGAKLIIPTKLNIRLWEESATGHIDDHIVLSGVKHGFSLQYIGPPLREVDIDMHESGRKYQKHIQEYIDTEIAQGAMVGPLYTPPFTPWCRTSPIMSRPKGDSERRRIIIDLSYPPNENVNQWVVKGNYYGQLVNHTLPRIDDVVQFAATHGFRVALATIDIKRAYRNFPGCPLDYPLNVIRFDNKYYLDLAMPFGARTSSLYMQKAADLISRALLKRGIPTHVYLDNVILYFTPDQNPQARMAEALEFMKALGLPLADEKVQHPSHKVKYLGIWIDTLARSLTMPSEKIQKFLDLINWIQEQEKVSKKIVQTLVGKTIHIVACVPAARTFINRILTALRSAHSEPSVLVDSSFKKDLLWFNKFLKKFNGRSMMKDLTPEFVIEADACLQGGGGRYRLKIIYCICFSPEVC